MKVKMDKFNKSPQLGVMGFAIIAGLFTLSSVIQTTNDHVSLSDAQEVAWDIKDDYTHHIMYGIPMDDYEIPTADELNINNRFSNSNISIVGNANHYCVVSKKKTGNIIGKQFRVAVDNMGSVTEGDCSLNENH